MEWSSGLFPDEGIVIIVHDLVGGNYRDAAFQQLADNVLAKLRFNAV